MIRVVSDLVTITCDTQEEWDAFTATLGEMPDGVEMISFDAEMFTVSVTVDQDLTANYLPPS